MVEDTDLIPYHRVFGKAVQFFVVLVNNKNSFNEGSIAIYLNGKDYETRLLAWYDKIIDSEQKSLFSSEENVVLGYVDFTLPFDVKDARDVAITAKSTINGRSSEVIQIC